MDDLKYQAGMAVPPGETLKEVLEENNMTQKELAARLGVTPKHVNKIVNGTATITTETSQKLESIFKIPATFWNQLELQYQETRTRLKMLPPSEEEKSISELIPYKKLCKMGLIEYSENIIEKIGKLREFFRVASLENILSVYSVAFRKSKVFKSEEFALISWINMAELGATEIDTAEFDIKKLKDKLDEIKALNVIAFKGAKSKLVDICSSIGIALVFVPPIEGAHINGATKWISNNKVLVAVSDRGVYEDIMWFSFFHEIGHVLQLDKTKVFIDEEGMEIEGLEKEADEFASNTLVNQEELQKFCDSCNYKDINNIRAFADKQNVHVGILIGQLLHNGYLDYNDREYKLYEQNRRKIKIR